MSARNGTDGVVKSTSAAGSAPHLTKPKSSPSSANAGASTLINPATTKYAKNSDSTPSQKQLPSSLSSSSLSKPPSGSTPSPSQNSSSSSLASMSSTVGSRSDSSSSKTLKREESSKIKAGDGTKRGLFGWIKHHITDMTESSKNDNSAGGGGSASAAVSGGTNSISSSMTSKSRGIKKKVETAASFARNNHLSDSMPSLVVQANAETTKPVVDTSGVKRRPSKNPAGKATSDELCGSGRLQVPGAGRFAPSADRNRWSSYDIVGGSGIGTFLVAVEDTDENAIDDAVVGDRNSSTSSNGVITVRPAYASNPDGTPTRHLRASSVDVHTTGSGSNKAHSVEAIHLALDKNDKKIDYSTNSDSGKRHRQPPDVLGDGTSAGTDGCAETAAADATLQSVPDVKQSVAVTNGPTTAASSLVGDTAAVGTEEQRLSDSFREKDDCIENAMRLRKTLIAQLIDIPAYEFDNIAEMPTVSSRTCRNAESDQREILLALLIQGDRLTVGISDILRFSRPVKSDQEVGSSSSTAASPTTTTTTTKSGGCSSSGQTISASNPRSCTTEVDVLRLFRDVGTQLRSQLTLLQGLIDSGRDVAQERPAGDTFRVEVSLDHSDSLDHCETPSAIDDLHEVPLMASTLTSNDDNSSTLPCSDDTSDGVKLTIVADYAAVVSIGDHVTENEILSSSSSTQGLVAE